MRVLTIAACPFPWPRGTPIRIHRMAEALVRRGHEIHLATYPIGKTDGGVSYELHRVEGTRMTIDSRPGPSWQKLLVLDPRLLRLTRRLLASRAFDLIHAHHYEGLIAALLARPQRGGLPVLFDAHTLLGTELPHYQLYLPGRLLAGVGTFLDRTLPRRADHVVAVTRRMRQWFADAASIPAERLSLIPNGVEYEHFSVPERAPGSAGAGTADGPSVVFAGTLAEYQGIDGLFGAFGLLRQRVPTARLRLITDSEPAPWHALLTRHGIDDATEIVSVSYQDLPGHLANADVLVNPRTECDGIPQKLLNYMAAGKPIVSCAGSASVLVDGKTGLVVPDGDTEAFASAIQRSLEDRALAAALGAAAARDAEQSYSWQRVAREIEGAYETMLEQGVRP